MSCSGEPAPAWHVGAAYGFTSTRIHFDEGDTATLTKHAVSASLERRLGERFTLTGALGAAIAGELGIEDTTHRMLGGPFVAATATYRVVDEAGWAPFLLASGSLGGSWGHTREGGEPAETFTAYDGRVGVTVGKTLFRGVTPYLAGRAFGLPVLWHFHGRSLTGGDAYHYQVGIGLSLRLGAADLLVEGVPLGERAVTAGVGWSL